jgi:hypothetical protein
MFGEGSETCVPVSGKAKRPAVRPSVDCATYGQESGERQGPQLHITDASLGSFLVFPLARSLAVSAMADEVRYAPGQRTPPARLFTSESARGGLGKRRPHSSGPWRLCFGKLWSHLLHSNVRSARPSGPDTIPTSIMRQVDGTPLFNFAHCRKFEAAVARPLVNLIQCVGPMSAA